MFLWYNIVTLGYHSGGGGRRWIIPLQCRPEGSPANRGFREIQWLIVFNSPRLPSPLPVFNMCWSSKQSLLCIKILRDCSPWISNLSRLSLFLSFFLFLLMRKKNIPRWTVKSPRNNEVHSQRMWVRIIYGWELIWLLTIVVSPSTN